MSDSMERVNAALAGRYRLVRRIGEGGMAVVYEAVDLRHDRTVALKVLRHEVASAVGADRFLAEIRTTAGLRHPHIVPLFDSGEADGILYYVMPLVEGETLQARLERDGVLPIPEALGIARDVGAALGHAHRHGLVHRDVKPANILLQEGEALVADFGIALDVQSADRRNRTATGVWIGTPAYMSPEQLGSGETVGPASDVYALAAVVFEMLTGSPPLAADTAGASMARTLGEEPPPVRSLRPEVPASTENALARALEKDPGLRFQSTEEFVEAAATPEPVAASGGLGGVGLAGVALALVALVGMGAWGWRMQRVAQARAELPALAELVADGSWSEAFGTVRRLERTLGDDPELARLRRRVSFLLTVEADREGVPVEIQRAPAPGEEAPAPRAVGETPVRDLRLAHGQYRVVLRPPGIPPIERSVAVTSRYARQPLGEERRVGVSARLEGLEAVPEDMVAIPGGSYMLAGPDAPLLDPAELGDFALDRYEVRNADFAEFVSGGGYASPEYWPAGSPIDEFTDRTGLPGPRGWSRGTFPEGRADHPVAGVSWPEAAAYCAWKGRRLPSVFEWEKAARDGVVAEGGLVMPWGMVASAERTAGRANFGLQSTTPVDAHPFGISPWGVYDLAGNVREWLANPMGSGYAVTGGSWDGPSYLHTEIASVPASRASPALGFRCARSADGTGSGADFASQGAARIPEALETPAYDPVDRAEFQRLLARYRYDPQPANPRVAERVETEHWTRERVWIDGPAGDSILVYLYTPRAGEPPYQAVVFVPGSDAFCCVTVAEATELLIGPLIQAGRAVVSVVLDGMVERSPDRPWPDPPTVAFRDQMIGHATEMRLGIDYAVSRPDINGDRLAYAGFSFGAGSRLGFSVVEPRFDAVFYLGGGIDERVKPTLPAADNVNFAAHLERPVLMVNGLSDEEHPWVTRGLPLWNLLPGPRERLLLEGAGHLPPLELWIPQVDDFLDRHLGPP